MTEKLYLTLCLKINTQYIAQPVFFVPVGIFSKKGFVKGAFKY